MKKWIYIIKHDRQAAISLLVVFLCITAIVVEFFTPREPHSYSDKETHAYDNHEKPYAVKEKEIHLQKFDPNTADSTVLLGLGLQPWQVRSIYKYRANGGAYTCPEDFARLYGLTTKKYRELRPYIIIGKEYRPASETVARPKTTDTDYNTKSTQSTTDYNENKDLYPKKIKSGESIALNTSDTTALMTVPGIGPYFARKIVAYREKLGGFVNKEQLLEIEGFPESALPYFTLSTTSIRKLNINKASAEKLRNHPYITYLMSKEIANYRRLRGNIQNIDDLSLLPSFQKDVINKLRPYIEY